MHDHIGDGPHPRMTLFSPYARLQEHASRGADAQAIVSGEFILTYGDLLERVSEFAAWLLDNGFIPGETTGICIRDEIGHLICAMALMCLGSPQMSLGAHEKRTTKRALIDKVGVTQLVVERADDWMDGVRTLVAPLDNRAAMAVAPKRAAAGFFAAQKLESVAVYQNTSGSTNIPKTFGLALERLLILSTRFAEDPKERRGLRTGSIEFDAHRLHRLCSLLAGNACIFLHHFNLRNLISLCERAEVTTIHIGGSRLAALIRSGADFSGRLPPFTAVQTGGMRVPGRLRQEIKRALTDNLWVSYATSEVGVISIATPEQHDDYPEGVGFPSKWVTVEIVGVRGEAIAPGEIGQIRVRKPGMARAYITEPRKASNFQDGWFYPRDLISQGDGAPLVFHGRTDDVMILNGINIFPTAIEDALESHPDVQEAIAYPIKSRIHGEIPAAAVVLKDGVQSRNVSHLLGHCRNVLGIRAPRRIVVIDCIPRNAAGKPLRRELAVS